MAERRRLDPRSLDRLEDALASLQHDSDLEALLADPDLSDASSGDAGDGPDSGVSPSGEATIDVAGIREALSDARAVLQLAQQAWPDVEPSDAVVAAILAEAESAARMPATADPPPERPRVHWVWRWLVPSVALAGSAALVLLLVQPDEDRVSGRSSAEEIAAAEAELVRRDDAKRAERAAEDDTTARSATLERAEEAPAPAAAAPPATDSPGALGGLSGDARDEGAARPSSGSANTYGGTAGGKGGGGAASGAMPKPAPSKKETSRGDASVTEDAFVDQEATKDGTWSRLEDAHRKRRKGDCTGAIRDYDAVLASKPDPVARAQALAGIGLCLERDGDFGGATDRYDQAREAYVGADTWLEGERATAPTPSEAKKRTKSKAASSTDPKADSLP